MVVFLRNGSHALTVGSYYQIVQSDTGKASRSMPIVNRERKSKP